MNTQEEEREKSLSTAGFFEDDSEVVFVPMPLSSEVTASSPFSAGERDSHVFAD